MSNRMLCIFLALLLVMLLVACSTNTPEDVITTVTTEQNTLPEESSQTEEQSPEDAITTVITEQNTLPEESSQTEEQSPKDLELFNEFDLLKIERKENSIENGFVMAIFIVQNKSDSLTLSNFTFEYLVDNGKGTPLDEVFRTDTYDGLFVLEPRQKTELDLMEYIGSNINDDMRIFLSSYSYDLNDNHYVVNVIEQSVSVSEISIHSNVSFEEKNILCFDDVQRENHCSFVNGGEHDIKTLEIGVAVYDEKNVLHGIETVTVVTLGDEPISSDQNGSAWLNQIYTKDNGYLLPVRYSYGIGTADPQGYNFFEINLITGEAVGSSNTMLLDNIYDMSPDQLRTEIELYTSTFGKKIADTPFEGYELEERISSEWLHFYDSSLFGVNGICTLVRDYDTLIITDFWFDVDNHDETTAAYLLKALELIYGTEYESETEDGNLNEAIWDLDKYSVEYNAKYGSIHIDTDIK